MTSYVPDTGDFAWLEFDPQAGKEQAGRRPALILSPRIYNTRSGLVLACPITSRSKGYPFEVAIPRDCAVQGVILADHLKSLDWDARMAKKLGRCPAAVLDEVRAKIAPLLGC